MLIYYPEFFFLLGSCGCHCFLMIITFCFTHGNISLISNIGRLNFPSKTRMLVPSKDCLQAKKDGIPSHAILKVSLFVNCSHHHLSVWDCSSPVPTNCLRQRTETPNLLAVSWSKRWPSFIVFKTAPLRHENLLVISRMQYPRSRWYRKVLTMGLDCQFGSGRMYGGVHICGAYIIPAGNPVFLTTSVEKLQVTQAVPFLESSR